MWYINYPVTVQGLSKSALRTISLDLTVKLYHHIKL